MKKVAPPPIVQTWADSYAHPDDLLDEMERESGVRSLPVVVGYHILVKVWVRPEKSSGGIIFTDQTRGEDEYQSAVGKVMAMGPQCYTGRHYDGAPRFPEGPWCKIRDWVLIPRYDAVFHHYAGLAFITIPDDKILEVVSDPAIVTMSMRKR